MIRNKANLIVPLLVTICSVKVVDFALITLTSTALKVFGGLAIRKQTSHKLVLGSNPTPCYLHLMVGVLDESTERKLYPERP